jgi:biopolymer transport protein TolQ
MNLLPEAGFLAMVMNATLVVKAVMAGLGIMSVISWTIIISKVFQYGRVRRRLAIDLNGFGQSSDLASGMRVLKMSKGSVLYPIGKETLQEMKRLEKASIHPTLKLRVSGDNLDRVLGQEVGKQIGHLTLALPFLATCANAAPFIGLFGTVWGIMNSFHSIGLQKSAALAAVAPGISEALVATAIGLGVAIPASMGYNFFLGRLQRIERQLNEFSGIFLNRAQLEMPWMPPTRSGREGE